MVDNEPREFQLDVDDDMELEDENLDPQNADAAAARQAYNDTRDKAADDDWSVSGTLYGNALTRAISANGFHPVVIFGTTNSGKTHVLLSLFNTLQSEHRVDIKIDLSEKPLILSDSDIGTKLHAEAKNLFESKTAAFSRGEHIPNTRSVSGLPFFVPIEFTVIDDQKHNVKFALLEGDGEFYKPDYDPTKPLRDLDHIYKPLRSDLEQFIGTYQGAISFIYLLPYTTDKVYAYDENPHEKAFVGSAEDTIVGVIKAYERCRKQFLDRDKHMLLLTKWDAHGQGKLNGIELLREDRHELERQLIEKYPKALTAFKQLPVTDAQRAMRAYCAGIIGPEGARQVKRDSLAYRLITKYHVDLTSWLYRNALSAADIAPVSPFREPSSPSFFKQLVSQLFGDRPK